MLCSVGQKGAAERGQAAAAGGRVGGNTMHACLFWGWFTPKGSRHWSAAETGPHLSANEGGDDGDGEPHAVALDGGRVGDLGAQGWETLKAGGEKGLGCCNQVVAAGLQVGSAARAVLGCSPHGVRSASKQEGAAHRADEGKGGVVRKHARKLGAGLQHQHVAGLQLDVGDCVVNVCVCV